MAWKVTASSEIRWMVMANAEIRGIRDWEDCKFVTEDEAVAVMLTGEYRLVNHGPLCVSCQGTLNYLYPKDDPIFRV